MANHGKLIVLALGLAYLLAPPVARADTAAARACAAGLPKDAKAIFDTTLPKIAPGANLRDLVTENTRQLAIAGTIERGTARDSAVEAAACLRRAES